MYFTVKTEMAGTPQNSMWTADNVIDGSSNQNYSSNTCAISNINMDKLKRTYLKMWFDRPFNIAYLEIYFRSDSK